MNEAEYLMSKIIIIMVIFQWRDTDKSQYFAITEFNNNY